MVVARRAIGVLGGLALAASAMWPLITTVHSTRVTGWLLLETAAGLLIALWALLQS